jgi:glutaredoxin
MHDRRPLDVGEQALSIIIYTKPGCPYCAKAREYYKARGIQFEDRNAQDNPVYRSEMLAITGGDPTVPVIVEDGRLKQIGWEGRG